MSCFVANYKTKITIIYFLNYQQNDNSMYKPNMYAIFMLHTYYLLMFTQITQIKNSVLL